MNNTDMYTEILHLFLVLFPSGGGGGGSVLRYIVVKFRVLIQFPEG